MRLNKFIASSGLCSRRKAEEFILNGNISINGKIIKDPAYNVELYDEIYYNDKRLMLKDKKIYLLLNKPTGITSTVKDKFAEKTVLNLINSKERLYPVGRLDKDSCGILILTNDGDLTYKLTHPKFEVHKEYFVKVEGNLTEKSLELFRKGIKIDGKLTAKAKIVFVEKKSDVFSYKVSIYEGRNRQIRNMFKALGCKVIFLQRTAIGDIKIGNLKVGSYRNLTDEEIKYLKDL